MLRINYVTLAWIVAQILNPLLWMIYDVNINIAQIMLITLFFSLPTLFIGVISFPWIKNLSYSATTRFLLFLTINEVSIFLTDFLFSLFFFAFDFFTDMLLFSVPAAISAALALFFTLPFYYKHVQKNDDHYEYSKQDL